MKSEEIYVVVRKGGWFETTQHIKKTWKGMKKYLKRHRLVKEGGYKIYKFKLKEESVVVDET